ncbi:ABC transporter permease subunit [Marinobacter bryozoorum]|uniref:ABC transporter permease subunit n=1 Tax=Marinobacter bryozoorum TaxID=256324 RepID=UPI002004B07D|nr:ABC transporter permease subunit [Marinobacter bryozoorum]MCK7543144.1 ABC transporter permease subunit [Marinobacter bryozoorum]
MSRPAARLCVMWLALLVSALWGSGALAQSGDGRLERIKERGTLIVGVKGDYPPWGMVNDQGELVGLEPDLAALLAERIGVDLELRAVTSANRLQRLDQGLVDVVIATLGDTAERREKADLLQPSYYSSGVRLLTRGDFPYTEWGAMRGRPVCLTEGAYFNRRIAERYLVNPVIFPGTRDTRLALQERRCLGWAYDDTVLAQVLAEEGWQNYQLSLTPILETPWAIAVAKGEGDRPLGRLIGNATVQWHRDGTLVDLQSRWQLPESAFLQKQHERWTSMENGEYRCRRTDSGDFPEACLETTLSADRSKIELPGWARQLRMFTGLDLTPLFDPFNAQRLVQGILMTLAISVASIIGSLVAGVGLAVVDHRFQKGVLAWLVRAPTRGLVAVARMTPPILQLYIVFFGLSGLLAAWLGISLSSFLVATVVFSFYAGASNAAVIGPALARLSRQHPDTPLRDLLAKAVEQSFEALVSIMVNIVKAAGMASTIALPEVISSVNTLISEGGDATSLMTLLLVFYFTFVMVVMALLNLLKKVVVS